MSTHIYIYIYEVSYVYAMKGTIKIQVFSLVAHCAVQVCPRCAVQPGSIQHSAKTAFNYSASSHLVLLSRPGLFRYQNTSVGFSTFCVQPCSLVARCAVQPGPIEHVFFARLPCLVPPSCPYFGF
jgi:hypothetical protein